MSKLFSILGFLVLGGCAVNPYATPTPANTTKQNSASPAPTPFPTIATKTAPAPVATPTVINTRAAGGCGTTAWYSNEVATYHLQKGANSQRFDYILQADNCGRTRVIQRVYAENDDGSFQEGPFSDSVPGLNGYQYKDVVATWSNSATASPFYYNHFVFLLTTAGDLLEASWDSRDSTWRAGVLSNPSSIAGAMKMSSLDSVETYWNYDPNSGIQYLESLDVLGSIAGVPADYDYNIYSGWKFVLNY